MCPAGRISSRDSQALLFLPACLSRAVGTSCAPPGHGFHLTQTRVTPGHGTNRRIRLVLGFFGNFSLACTLVFVLEGWAPSSFGSP